MMKTTLGFLAPDRAERGIPVSTSRSGAAPARSRSRRADTRDIRPRGPKLLVFPVAGERSVVAEKCLFLAPLEALSLPEARSQGQQQPRNRDRVQGGSAQP